MHSVEEKLDCHMIQLETTFKIKSYGVQLCNSFLISSIKSQGMKPLGSYISKRLEEPQQLSQGTGKKPNTAMSGR